MIVMVEYATRCTFCRNEETTSQAPIQVSGGSGQFLFEEQDSGFASDIDDDYKLMGADGVQITGTWVTATTVGTNVSTHLLYFNVPEPVTATLSLAALVALCARRRRR